MEQTITHCPLCDKPIVLLRDNLSEYYNCKQCGDFQNMGQSEEAYNSLLKLRSVKIGDKIMRRKTNGGELDTWVECTVNETYLNSIKEFPQDYKPTEPIDKKENPGC